ncbi:MAG: hypothetical protein Pars2KO_20330 [Parasphingorhabdus sp.]
MLLTLGSPAQATKDTKAGTEKADEIVVTGQKTKTEIIQELIVNQFNISRGSRHSGQYARFAAPICPSVGGLPEKQAAIMEDRIRDIAEVAELSVAPAKCKANLFVVAVDDGSKEIESLRKKRANLFISLSHRERDKIMESDGPVYSWKTTVAMSNGGRHSAKAGTIDIMADSLGEISVRGQRSHIKSKIQQSDFVGINYSYLLIEKQALKDISLNQLADYAALVSLIDIDVNFDTPPPANSILSLFAGLPANQSNPGSISEGDMLMLRGLYKVPANVKAPLQRSAMLHTIDEALKSEDGSEK